MMTVMTLNCLIGIITVWILVWFYYSSYSPAYLSIMLPACLFWSPFPSFLHYGWGLIPHYECTLISAYLYFYYLDFSALRKHSMSMPAVTPSQTLPISGVWIGRSDLDSPSSRASFNWSLANLSWHPCLCQDRPYLLIVGEPVTGLGGSRPVYVYNSWILWYSSRH